jgi:WW domain
LNNRCVVWTGQGQVFFYNPSTKTSIWERPEELMQRADVDKAINNPPDQLPTHNLRNNGDGILPNLTNDMVQLLANQPTKLFESDSSEETVNKRIKIEMRSIFDTFLSKNLNYINFFSQVLHFKKKKKYWERKL